MQPDGGLRIAPLADVNIRCRAADGHAQRSQRQILLHTIADGPPNDAPGEKVNDHGQINPPLARPDIGDVACPLLVRPARLEVLLQEILRDVEGVIAVGRALELSAANDLNAILAHKSPDTALADADAQLLQLLRHAGSTVAAKAQAMLVADMGQEHHVAPLTMRRGAMLPGMQAAF